MKRGRPLERSTPLPPFSRKRWDKVSASGFRPTSTFTPRPREAGKAKASPRRTDPKPAERDVVRGRSGGVCEFRACTRGAEQMHHRRPRRMGGSTAPDVNGAANLVDLCAWHHRWVEFHRTAAEALGLLLSARADPLRVPVLTRHDEQPVWLLPDGTWLRFEEACA